MRKPLAVLLSTLLLGVGIAAAPADQAQAGPIQILQHAPVSYDPYIRVYRYASGSCGSEYPDVLWEWENTYDKFGTTTGRCFLLPAGRDALITNTSTGVTTRINAGGVRLLASCACKKVVDIIDQP